MPKPVRPAWPVRSAARYRPGLWGAVLIVALTVMSYMPVLGRGGFIWDDDQHVQQNMTLRSGQGLVTIWTDPHATPQYYPLVHTSFWIEYHLWGLNPFGYHLVNVLLHAAGAIVLWRVLVYLEVKGALLAAVVFAIHPVHVESVAWVTERKNVLSGLLYLLSAAAYLRFALPQKGAVAAPLTLPAIDRDRGPWKFYFIALVLFVGSLLSKTVTATLPAALCVVLWWKKPRLRWADVWPLAPMLVIGAAMGILTAVLEVSHVGAAGNEWNLNLVERFLVAGNALWFYIGKLLFPANLTFIYPRWEIHWNDASLYLAPLAFVCLLAALWLLRKKVGKGPLAGMLFFAGTLFPALGFFNVFPFLYSFVADHFQYLGSLGVIVPVCSLVARLPRKAYVGLAGLIVLSLGAVTFGQGFMYESPQTLWRETIRRNDRCWMAHNNLANLLLNQATAAGDLAMYEEAIDHYRQAFTLKPDDAYARVNYGVALERTGQRAEAAKAYQAALRLDPNLGSALAAYGSFLLDEGQVDEALEHFRRACGAEPTLSSGYDGLGRVGMMRGDFAEALKQFRKSAELSPNAADPWLNLGLAYVAMGDVRKAMGSYRQGLKVQSQHVPMLANLSWMLATDEDAANRNGQEALTLAARAVNVSRQQSPQALLAYAAACAETGKFDQAIRAAQLAGNLANRQQLPVLAAAAENCLTAFRAGQPYRETRPAPATQPASQPGP